MGAPNVYKLKGFDGTQKRSITYFELGQLLDLGTRGKIYGGVIP